MIVSFWSTPEVDSWSRGFTYDDYVNLKAQKDDWSQPLSFDGYSALCHLLDVEHEDSFK